MESVVPMGALTWVDCFSEPSICHSIASDLCTQLAACGQSVAPMKGSCEDICAKRASEPPPVKAPRPLGPVKANR